MNRASPQKSRKPRRAGERPSRQGQVLVEFALAAVGLLAMAFMTARVAQWMNQSLVERNERYQRTRVAAGQIGAGLVGAEPVPDVHLIGPSSGRSSPPSKQASDAALFARCDAEEMVARANELRGPQLARVHADLEGLREELLRKVEEFRNKMNRSIRGLREAKRLREEASTLDARASELENAMKDVPCPPKPICCPQEEGEAECERICSWESDGSICGQEPDDDVRAQAPPLRQQAENNRGVAGELERMAPILKGEAEAAERRARQIAQNELVPLSDEAQRLIARANELRIQARLNCASGRDAQP